MESLLGKKLYLKSQSEVSVTDFPINLTFEYNGRAYNQIRITCRDDDSGVWDFYFDDELMAWGYGNTLHWDSWGGYIIITGGTDVDNPAAIETMLNISERVMCAPNHSAESLDNKVLEFKPRLTTFPYELEELGVINGIFKIRCDGGTTCNGIITANTVDFSNAGYGKIVFKGYAGYQCTYNYNVAPSGQWVDQRGAVIENVVFEDFKYTGLENNSKFMSWLSKNAKISPKRYKDRKIVTFRDITTLRFRLGADACAYPPAIFYEANAGGYIVRSDTKPGNEERLRIIQITLDATSWCIRTELYVPQYNREDWMPSDTGYYDGTFYTNPSGGMLILDNGQQINWGEPITITNFNCDVLGWNPDFIDWFTDSATLDITLRSVLGATVKFSPILSEPALFSSDWYYYSVNGRMSYKLAGQQRTEWLDGITYMHFGGDDFTPSERLAFCSPSTAGDGTTPYLGYSFAEQRWYYSGSDEVPEDVIITFGRLGEDYGWENNLEFSKWVCDNADDFYVAKGINTFEELVTGICELLRFNRENHAKIYVQDILPRLWGRGR